jgi:hypothetical protein
MGEVDPNISWSCLQILSSANFDFGNNFSKDSSIIAAHAAKILPKEIHDELIGPNAMKFYAQNYSQFDHLVRDHTKQLQERTYDQALAWIEWRIKENFRELSKNKKTPLITNLTALKFAEQAIGIGEKLKVDTRKKASASIGYCFEPSASGIKNLDATQKLSISWLSANYDEPLPNISTGIPQDVHQKALDTVTALQAKVQKYEAIFKVATVAFGNAVANLGTATNALLAVLKNKTDPVQVESNTTAAFKALSEMKKALNSVQFV